MAIVPVAKAVYVCDDVVMNPRTGKVSLFNIWERVRVPDGTSLPYRLDRISVFVWWKGGNGISRTWVDLVQGESRTVLRRSDVTELDFPDRTSSAYGSYRFEDCVFIESGYYFIEAYADGEFVDDQQIEVVVSGGDE